MLENRRCTKNEFFNKITFRKQSKYNIKQSSFNIKFSFSFVSKRTANLLSIVYITFNLHKTPCIFLLHCQPFSFAIKINTNVILIIFSISNIKTSYCNFFFLLYKINNSCFSILTKQHQQKKCYVATQFHTLEQNMFEIIIIIKTKRLLSSYYHHTVCGVTSYHHKIFRLMKTISCTRLKYCLSMPSYVISTHM